MKISSTHMTGVIALFLVCILWGLIGCHKKSELESRAEHPSGIIEQVENVAVLQLHTPAFNDLSLNDRIAAYYISEAILASRDIPYDQIHPRNVEMRRFFEDIGKGISYGAQKKFTDPYWVFLKKFWIHNGFYDLLTLRKLSTSIDGRIIPSLTFVALANTGGKIGTLLEVSLKLDWLKTNFFMPSVDPILFSDPTKSGIHSPVNFYEDVSLDEARNFPARFPHNSRLAVRRDKIVELVYRTGDETFAPGPYAAELEKVVENLEKARPYLSVEYAPVIDNLLAYFRTGNPVRCEAASLHQRKSNPPVDFVLGFNDRRYDPLGQKGLWTGLMFIRDDAAQENVNRLLKQFTTLRGSFPGGDLAIYPEERQDIRAVQLLTAIGNNAPLCPDIYIDPPLQDHKSQSRSFIFTNVIEARLKAQATIGAARQKDEPETFLYKDLGIREALARYAVGLEPRPVPSIPFHQKGDKFNRSVIEYTLRELAVIWMLTDPSLVKNDSPPNIEAAQEVFRRFGKRYSSSLTIQNKSVIDIESLATLLIGNYFVNEDVIELIEDNGRKNCRISDKGPIREKTIEFAIQMNEILTDNSSSKIAKIVAEISREPVITDARQSRKKRVESYVIEREALIMPEIQPVINSMGGITDADITYPEDFAEQMFRWGGWDTEEQ